MELPILSFESAKHWEKWLAKNHELSPGMWLRIEKKGSGRQSLTYAEALDVALCYGWIDGQKKSDGDRAWLQKFTCRGPAWTAFLLAYWDRWEKAGSLAISSWSHTERYITSPFIFQ